MYIYIYIYSPFPFYRDSCQADNYLKKRHNAHSYVLMINVDLRLVEMFEICLKRTLYSRKQRPSVI